MPYVILKPGRLTDEPATERVAASLEETDGTNTVSRGTSSTAGACTWYISPAGIRPRHRDRATP
ncbi:hypothetical protein [Halomonas sp. LBP4]|uniref:hypothetical protein n=1 Tax=Halomonas sp. LBP4 TaxID=2044917 RepID=UPI0035A0AE5D